MVTSFKNKLTDVLSGKSLCVQRTRWRGPAPDPLNATEENRKLLSEEQAGGSRRFLRSPHVAHRLYFMEIDWPARGELPRAATSDPRLWASTPHTWPFSYPTRLRARVLFPLALPDRCPHFPRSLPSGSTCGLQSLTQKTPKPKAHL